MSIDEIRRAYLDLVGDLPPEFCRDAVDLRPLMAHADELSASAIIVAGPDDLRELRCAVERVTGPTTWPFRGGSSPEWPPVEMHSEQIRIQRPAQLMRFMVTIDDLLSDRSAAWRTRKTLHEALGASLEGVDSVTISACRFERV